MPSENHILDKIESWADRLPYRSLSITIEMKNKTLTLNKEKATLLGLLP